MDTDLRTTNAGLRTFETPEETVIRIEGLTKRYGDLVAVDGVDLDVRRGEVFGILGPNGAGKTTTLEMIEGLRSPDTGEIEVAGYDAIRETDELKRVIGVQLQATALFDYLNLQETLELFADLYGADSSPARIWELLETASLTEKATSRVEQLSGGQQQRLSLALALVNDPRILFLDEPTTGLDLQSRRNLWESVRGLRRTGKTVVLTTHYMEEAAELCDRVAIMDHGRILICDSPLALVRSLEADAIITTHLEGSPGAHLDANLDLLAGVTDVGRAGEELRLRTADVPATMSGLLHLANERGLRLANLSVKNADLEDVFIAYTGRGLRS